MPILLGLIPAAVSLMRIARRKTLLKTFPGHSRVRQENSFAHSFSAVARVFRKHD